MAPTLCKLNLRKQKAPSMEGWLVKKGQRAAVADSWKRRFFTFERRTRTLRYYEDEAARDRGEHKGEVVVRGVNPCEHLQGASGHKPHRFDFSLVDDSGARPVLGVSASDPAERQRWIDAVGSSPPLYDDKFVTVFEHGVLVKWYGTRMLVVPSDTLVPFEKVVSVEAPEGGCAYAKQWGMGLTRPDVWFACDMTVPRRVENCLVLEAQDSMMKMGFSVEAEEGRDRRQDVLRLIEQGVARVRARREQDPQIKS